MNEKYFLIIPYGIMLLFSVLNLLGVFETNISKSTMELFSPSIDCSNLSGEDVIACEVGVVKGFYKYNVTPDNISLSIDELRVSGGDCKDWAEYYVKVFESYGFNVYLEKVEVDEKDEIIYLHDFVIVSSKDFYCIVDQRVYQCFGITWVQ